MTDLSRLRSVGQLQAERMRLEQQAQQQRHRIEQETRTIRRTWRTRLQRVDRFADTMSLLLPKVGHGTLLIALLSKLRSRFRKQSQ